VRIVETRVHKLSHSINFLSGLVLGWGPPTTHGHKLTVFREPSAGEGQIDEVYTVALVCMIHGLSPWQLARNAQRQQGHSAQLFAPQAW
jgi:hypothetical protein